MDISNFYLIEECSDDLGEEWEIVNEKTKRVVEIGYGYRPCEFRVKAGS
jgi:hypothetical protein